MISRRALIASAAILPASALAQLVNPGAPTLGERDGLINPTWTPADLGASLLAWWDAERPDLITRDGGGLVSSWRDVVGGYNAVQATGTKQPIWSATSFNGRPGVTFDGVDDELTLATAPVSFPAGATPCEMWGLADQQSLPASAVTRAIASYGSTGGADSRSLCRTVTTGVNRAFTIATSNGANNLVDFSGRHVERNIVTGTNVTCEVDGIAGPPTAVVPATVATRFRVGAQANPTAVTLWQGPISAVLITSILTAGQSTQLYAHLNGRL